MGLWAKIRNWWGESKERDEELEKQAIIDKHMRELERSQLQQGQSPRIPPTTRG